MSDNVVAAVQGRFATFGGERTPDPYNPISHWTSGSPAIFAARYIAIAMEADRPGKAAAKLFGIGATASLRELLRWLDGEDA